MTNKNYHKVGKDTVSSVAKPLTCIRLLIRKIKNLEPKESTKVVFDSLFTMNTYVLAHLTSL